jgi:hypothetical protein
MCVFLINYAFSLDLGRVFGVLKVALDPSVCYSLMVDVRGTAEAYYEMTVITLECKQEAPFQHPHPKQPWAELSLIS